MGTVIPYHSDSRTAERWSKMELVYSLGVGKPYAERAVQLRRLNAPPADTAPSEYCAPDWDGA